MYANREDSDQTEHLLSLIRFVPVCTCRSVCLLFLVSRLKSSDVLRVARSFTSFLVTFIMIYDLVKKNNYEIT